MAKWYEEAIFLSYLSAGTSGRAQDPHGGRRDPPAAGAGRLGAAHEGVRIHGDLYRTSVSNPPATVTIQGIISRWTAAWATMRILSIS